MTILVIGSKGQVGTELGILMKGQGRDAILVDLPEIDITRPDSVSRFIGKPEIDIVINAAAYTAVDKAESEPELAFAVNAEGPGLIADACQKRNIPLIHISTDYVFDGTKNTPWTEDDPVSPIGIYGQSKAKGDVLVAGRLEKHIIVRTSWVCSAHGANFVKTMLRLGCERETIRVVDDQTGCPTFASDIAEAIGTILERCDTGQSMPWGTYHYCGKDAVTWYGFAQEIFRQAGQYWQLKLQSLLPIPTSEYPTATERPMYSVLDCTKISRNFGIPLKPWQASLEKTITDLHRQESGDRHP